MTATSRFAIVFLSIALALVALPAMAQIPDEFTNLRLLPEDIEKESLVRTMKDFASGLGVRCKYCHVGPDNLQGMDFASDEKPQKRTARKMLSMARAINGELLADLATVEEDAPHQVVSCYTCHRRQTKPPRHLVRVLAETYSREGLNAALDEYRSLRQEHFAAGRYDFRDRTLNSLARIATDAGNTEDALAVLEANQEMYPDSADVEAAFGFLYLQTEDSEKAEASFRRALDLDPENGNARFGLSRIEPTEEKKEE